MELQVKVLQEWLCYFGYKLKIDGVFGPFTKKALQDFQVKNGLPATGAINQETWNLLLKPVKTVTQILPKEPTLPCQIVQYARLHASQHPIEIGGQNRGPWVRLYMNNQDGTDQLWCAGFVSYILWQSCKTLEIPMPFQTSPSCYWLAHNARSKKLLQNDKEIKKEHLPGSIFLVKKSGMWEHTGIIISTEEETFRSIEGNTNDEGGAEGYEVCERIRRYENKDYIVLG